MGNIETAAAQVDDSRSGGGAVRERCGAPERECGAGAILDGDAGAGEGDVKGAGKSIIPGSIRRHCDAAKRGVLRDVEVSAATSSEGCGSIGDRAADPIRCVVEMAIIGSFTPRRIARVGNRDG